MFCSVKKGKDKYGNIYKFYLCNRYRDKETGKVKSSDKYIMTLQEIDFTDLRTSIMAKHIKKVLKEKDIVNEIEQDLVYDKYLDIRGKILEKEREKEREKQEQEYKKQEQEYKKQQKEYEEYRKYYNSYSSGFSSGTSSISFDDTTKDIAKEFIKLGFRAMAKKYHPDIVKDSGEKMKIINDVKSKLDSIL